MITNTNSTTTTAALAIAIAARIPVMLWGSPGSGKTSVLNSIAERSGLHCETVLAAIREPSDFSGLPVVRPDGTVSFAAPSWAQRLVDAGGGLLFLDELSTAPPAVQAALLRVVLDRVVGDLPLPADTAVVAAANPPEQAANGWDLSAPLANRFVHLEWTTDGRAVAHGLAHGFSVPALPVISNSDLTTSSWWSLIPAFLHVRPELHLMVPSSGASLGRAWPSPRSWQMAMHLTALADVTRVERSVAAALLSGCVGAAAAVELMAWADSFDLPDPDVVLAHPTTCVLPGRADQLYAVMTSVVAAVRRDCTSARWNAAWEVVGRVTTEHAPDLAATAAIELARIQPRGATPNRAVTQFLPILREAGLL